MDWEQQLQVVLETILVEVVGVELLVCLHRHLYHLMQGRIVLLVVDSKTEHLEINP
jgi:hypothetical protein